MDWGDVLAGGALGVVGAALYSRRSGEKFLDGSDEDLKATGEKIEKELLRRNAELAGNVAETAS